MVHALRIDKDTVIEVDGPVRVVSFELSLEPDFDRWDGSFPPTIERGLVLKAKNNPPEEFVDIFGHPIEDLKFKSGSSKAVVVVINGIEFSQNVFQRAYLRGFIDCSDVKRTD